jgi:hypothetical protein
MTVPFLGLQERVHMISQEPAAAALQGPDCWGGCYMLCLCSVLVSSPVCGLPRPQARAGCGRYARLARLGIVDSLKLSANEEVYLARAWRRHSNAPAIVCTACPSPVAHGTWWRKGCCEGNAQHAADMCAASLCTWLKVGAGRCIPYCCQHASDTGAMHLRWCADCEGRSVSCGCIWWLSCRVAHNRGQWQSW